MKYLERFFWQKKKDTHISDIEVERIFDIIDMFADDNNMGREVVWDLPKLKEIKYYTRYNSKAELSIAHDNNTDINFSIYCNDREAIFIEDKFGYMDLEDKWPEGNALMDKMFSLYRRMKRMCPNLKFEMPKGPMKWNIKITKD